MGQRQAGIQSPRNCDASVRQAIMQLASVVFGLEASPEFESVTLSDLTASRLVWTDSSKGLASKDLVDLVAGTANEINVTDDTNGGIIIGLVDPLIVAKGVQVLLH